jgi:putative hemolysin
MARVGHGDRALTLAPFAGAADFQDRWGEVDFLALPRRDGDPYVAGFANSTRCVEAAQRLRFEVFNLELEEGLASSMETGLDRDRYDAQMTHLVLVDQGSGRIVGTYRMQAGGKAARGGGIYSAEEYDLTPLGPYLDESLELGRACLAADHRNFRAMFAMWLGIGAYMNAHGLRYVFGCCSLTTQDMDEGWRALKAVREGKCVHRDIWLRARPTHSCGPPEREHDPALGPALKLPKLFRTYLRLGALVVSEPAIDRAFGTVDFLILMDGKTVNFSRLDVIE